VYLWRLKWVVLYAYVITIQYSNRVRIRIYDLDFGFRIITHSKDIKIRSKLRLESGKKIGLVVKSLTYN